jgi:hypothetical protein
MGYWSDLLEVMSNISPNSSEASISSQEDSWSLFRAVRSAIGVQPQDTDCADVAFWEWQEMRHHLLQVWEALDKVASRRSSRREFACVWVHQPEQSGLDVVEFINEACAYAPEIPSLKVTRRPDAFLMVNIGKVDSAIASTIAVIVRHSQLPYGEVLQKLLNGGGSDEESLEFLDNEILRLNIDRDLCDKSPIPRELIRAKQKVRDQLSLSSMSVSAFLEVLDSSNNLTNISDNTLLTRLLQIAPEDNKAIAKKVDAIRMSLG